MSKPTVLLPNNFYNISIGEWDKKHSFNFDIEQVKKINSVLAKPNQNVIINFDDKKDRRKIETKVQNALPIYFGNFFMKQTINSDLSFIQDPDSSTIFSLDVSNSQTGNTKDIDNTFTFKGNCKMATLASPSFTNYVIEQYDYSKKLHLDDFSTRMDFCITDDSKNAKTKNVAVKSANYITINGIECPTLEKISFDCKNINFNIDKIKASNLKLIEFKNQESIGLDVGEYSLSVISKGDYSKQYQFDRNSLNFFKEQLSNFQKNYGNSCKIRISPSTWIYSLSLLPELKNTTAFKEAYGILAKDLLKSSKIVDGYIEITPIELLKACWNIKQQKLESVFVQINNTFSEVEKTQLKAKALTKGQDNVKR